MLDLLLFATLVLQDAPKTGGPFAIELDKPQSKYFAVVPDDYTAERSWPLMILLHGAGDTAENFIAGWVGGAQKAKMILAAVKSRDQGWQDSDGDIILGALADMKKRYVIDPERVMLTGYSSGGFMATGWGFRNTTHWRAISAIAGASQGGGKEYKAAIGRMSVFIECGDRDPNLSICKQVFEKVKKDGFDCDSIWVPGMEHSPIKPEAFDWVYEKLASRLDAPAECVRRAKKAQQSKRFADAIADFKAAAAGADEKAAKAAKGDLEKIEKAANDKLAEAEKKLAAGDKPGAKKAYEEVSKYAGLECATQAKEALKSLN